MRELIIPHRWQVGRARQAPSKLLYTPTSLRPYVPERGRGVAIDANHHCLGAADQHLASPAT